MKSTKSKEIILCGQLLANDSILLSRLREEFQLILCAKAKNIRSAIRNRGQKIVLLEIGEGEVELKLLKKIKCGGKKVPIIALGPGGSRDIVVEAFKYGACDFFKIPYNRELLIERIRAVINQNILT